MKKLLIGYDGSNASKKALLDLESAAIPYPVEAIVMSVADVWLPSAETAQGQPGAAAHPSKTALAAYAEAQRLSKEGAHLLIKRLPDWRITPEAAAGSPAWELALAADRWNPDLIVIGAHSQPMLDRYFFGSIASEVIVASRCSVRVCRPALETSESARAECPRIFLAIDGSADSAEAYRVVAERNWPKNASIRIATVLDASITDTLEGGRFAESVHEHFSGLAENIASLALHLAQELRAKGFAADAVVLEGNPKSELLQAAEDWAADCVFIGARGLHHDNRRRLGSVASAIARRAHCSVEIIRTPQATTTEAR
jgi:nucleotide-binding universal stress UspA family protein